VDFNKIQDTLSKDYNCEWKFSKAKAPWENGICERMVQSVKRSLRKAMHAALLTFEEMMTIVIEIEALINNRPLSALLDDNLLPITPAELVAGRPLTALPDPPVAKNSEKDKLEFPALWRKRKAVLNSFWKRWRRDYMMMLSPLKKWRKSDEQSLGVGDVVLIMESEAPRNTWKMARVLETYMNTQGQVTSAKLKTPRGRPIHRSVRQLALLEANMAVRGPPVENRAEHADVVLERDEEGAVEAIEPENAQAEEDQDMVDEARDGVIGATNAAKDQDESELQVRGRPQRVRKPPMRLMY